MTIGYTVNKDLKETRSDIQPICPCNDMDKASIAVVLDIPNTRNPNIPTIPYIPSHASPLADTPNPTVQHHTNLPMNSTSMVSCRQLDSAYNPESPIRAQRRHIINMETGEVVYITSESAAKYRTCLKMDGLIEWGKMHGYSFNFLTLTFSPRPHLSNNEIVKMRDSEREKFVAKLRRIYSNAGMQLKYVWVISLQLERFLSGDAAGTPYHFLVACPANTLPNQQPVINAKGQKHWKTVVDGSLLTRARLQSLWSDSDGRCLGTVNCGIVRSLPATRAYMLANEQQAEAHRVSRRRRFGGSPLGMHAAPKSIKLMVKQELAMHPEHEYNHICRKNGLVKLQVRNGNRITYEKVVRSPWTTDPTRWLERQHLVGSSPQSSQQLPGETAALAKVVSMPEVLDAIPLNSTMYSSPVAASFHRIPPALEHDLPLVKHVHDLRPCGTLPAFRPDATPSSRAAGDSHPGHVPAPDITRIHQKDGTCSTFQPATEISAHVNGAVADKLISQDGILSFSPVRDTDIVNAPINPSAMLKTHMDDFLLKPICVASGPRHAHCHASMHAKSMTDTSRQSIPSEFPGESSGAHAEHANGIAVPVAGHAADYANIQDATEPVSMDCPLASQAGDTRLLPPVLGPLDKVQHRSQGGNSCTNGIAVSSTSPTKIAKKYDVFTNSGWVYPNGYIRSILFLQDSRPEDAR